ncbi:MAG: hypothetical protein RLZZ435_1540, partial [Cyanobacteriota bacterium]
DALSHLKVFLLHRPPTQLSHLSFRHFDSTGIFYSPLPTGTNHLDCGHISGFDSATMGTVILPDSQTGFCGFSEHLLQSGHPGEVPGASTLA